jgi:hypothetical protein
MAGKAQKNNSGMPLSGKVFQRAPGVGSPLGSETPRQAMEFQSYSVLKPSWLWKSIARGGKNGSNAVKIPSRLWNSITRASRMLAQPRRWRLLANTLGIALAVVLNTACSGKSFDLLLEKPTTAGTNCTNTGSPPTTPADLAAANAGGGAFRLTWVASKDDTTPHSSMVYEICQTTTSGGCSGGSFSVTYSVTGQTKYTTSALTNGTTYFFTIRARDAECNVSAVSPQVRVTAATTPQWQQTAYLKAPNAEATDLFGRSVAISGDTIVVGANGEDSNSTAVCNAPFGSCGGLSDNSAGNAGAAYVFERDGSGNWQQKAYLKAPNTGANDVFGVSVAISGDTIVVGAFPEDSNSTVVCNAPFGSCAGLSNNSAGDAGAAYVFERDGSGAWQQKAYLKAPNTDTGDFFGYSVAISGDTIVVGANREASNSTAVCNEFTSSACDNAGGDGPNNNGASFAGAAYVFDRDGAGAWQQKAYLKAPNTDANDEFGSSVAISGDTIVVGAYREASNSTAVCNEFASSACDNAGGDGPNNNGASSAGAAYVFERDGSGNWQQKAYLKAPNTGMNDEFGYSVAISGDTIVVGAYGEASNSTAVCNEFSSTACDNAGGNGPDNNGAGSAGAAYVFERDGSGNWQQKAYLKAPNAEGSDQFGYSVAISGDTIVVGAYLEDSNSTAVCNAPFGSCGGLSDNSAGNAGAAYVFERDGSGAWWQKAYLKAPNTETNDNFGISVAISGDTIVVGANREASNSTAVCNAPFSGNCAAPSGTYMGNNSASLAGAAYVFERK